MDSFQYILDYYYRFLQGELQEVPTHFGPLDEESAIILPQLLQLNRLGFLTVESQPGEKEVYTDLTFPFMFPHPQNVTFKSPQEIISVQRGQVSGYMTIEMAYAIERELNPTELLMFITELDNPDSNGQAITITMSYTSDNVYQHVFTSSPVDYPDPKEELTMILQVLQLPPLTEDLVHVTIIDPIWGRPTYLFDVLINSFNFGRK